jgi:SAM-dependent methyltransferase
VARLRRRNGRHVVTCSCCFDAIADRQFNERLARRDLDRYRSAGPGSTARLVRDLLVEAGPLDGLLLDVGAGVGAVTFELLARGVSGAIVVDASSAYLMAASEEAASRGLSDAIRFVKGDFLDVASELPVATVVTLDRVICCHPLYERLLDASLKHSERWLALSYPRNVWYVHVAVALENALRWLRRNRFRAFVHPADRMTHIIERAGFTRLARRQTWQWSVDVYERSGS